MSTKKKEFPHLFSCRYNFHKYFGFIKDIDIFQVPVS